LYYKSFSTFLEKYEEAKDKSSSFQANSLAHVRLISGEKGGQLKEKLELMVER
jgi:hypothetical protein